MGTRMATNIANAGFELIVYNRTRTTAEQIALSNGAQVGETPAAVAAASDIVITMLADVDVVTTVFHQKNGILEGIRQGSVAVDMGTTGPEAVQDLGRSVRKRGASFMDACVSGSTALASRAELTVMVGGDAADFARVDPVLRTMASHVFHVGPLGAGTTLKLAVNTVIYGLCEALSEGLIFAERAGIDRSAAYEVFAASAVAAPFVHYRRTEFERPGEAPVAFRLALAKKDMDLILAMAHRIGAPMPQGRVNQAILDAAIGAGFADHDVSAIAEYLRQQSDHLDKD
jgi:3-hydroxyisobutyrate dehydrogenase-like beta-hydroxyacid dehydrogenase